MCDPVSIAIAGAALSVAGTGASAVGSMRARDATNAATQQAMANTAAANRRAYERAAATNEDQARANTQAINTVTQAAPRVAQAPAELEQAAALRTGQYMAASPAETGYLPGQVNAPQVVRDAVDAQRAKTAVSLGQQAAGLGNMRGWGDTVFGINRTVQQTGETAGQIAGAARGNARVAAAGAAGDERLLGQQQALDNFRIGLATQTGSGMRAIGDVAKGVGNIGVAYGLNPSGWAGIFGRPVPASTSAMAATGRAAGPV